MTAESEIQPLVERLRGGRCVLCAGSRLADGDFRALVGQLLSRVPGVDPADAEHVLQHRPLAAAGFVRRRLGERFVGELQRATTVGGELPEAVTLLGQLPFRAVVTTGYTDAFERAFAKDGAQPKVYTPRDAAELKKDGKARFVFKALGDPARADTIVWSAEDLQVALADGGYRTVAHDLYRTRSFLFLGFDTRDPDLGILLERVLSGARASDADHYAVLPGLTAMEQEELYAAYRIRVLSETDALQLVRALKTAIGEHTGPGLPDDDDAEGWIALLGENPTRDDARERLTALEAKLRDLGDFDRLIELYLGRVDVEPEAVDRARLLSQVAQVFEDEVGDLSKAFTALLAAYKEDPKPELWKELERLASATGMWTELLSEMAEVVPTLPEATRADGWVRIARLYGDKLGHAEYALTSLDEALKLDGTLADAQEMRITLLRRCERWGELAEALGRLAMRETDGPKRAELYLEEADIFETRLGDGQRAVASYEQAIEAEPASQGARAALEALLRRRGEWKRLLEVLDDRAKRAEADEARVIRREAAAVCGEKLGDRRAAITRYEALRAEDPSDLDTLRALERLYAEEGRHEQVLEALAWQADAAPSDNERGALYRRMATEWEELPGGAVKAAGCLERLIKIDPKAEDAFRSLARIYQRESDWPKLVETLRRYAAIVPTQIRGELFAQLGRVYEEQLKDAPHAIQAYLEVEQSLPGHAEAQAALCRLYEKTGAWKKAVELYDRRVGQAEVKSQKVELLARAGELTAERLGDSKAAETLLARALELDPTHVPSMAALVEIYRKHGEFLRAAKLLVEAVEHTPNRLERTRMLVEAGEIYEGLEDEKKATELYLFALEVDPEHVEAAERVSALLYKGERWAELVPVLEVLTRLAGREGSEVDTDEQIERLVRLGRAARAVGELDRAQKAYARAAELDPTNKVAQLGRAELLFDREEWADALAAFEKVFEHAVDTLPPSQRVELLYHLGTCELRLGEKERAREYHQAALDLDPAHRPTLLLQVEYGEAQPESLVDAKKALLLTAPPEEKVKLLVEIGDLYLEKLAEPALAAETYREALELKPEDHKILHKCLEVYSESKHWAQALDMLERLIAVEKDPRVRAKYRHAAGLICRDELGRSEQAMRLLTEALDDDGTHERASQALEQLLTERQEWKELARYYRRAVKRLGPESPHDQDGQNAERLRLWSSMGELYLDKLGERDTALTALEVALTFDRGNLERHRRIADLYVQAGPDHFDKAIVEHQILLRGDKQRIHSYRSLKHLYIQTGQRDKSAQVSYALTFLKKGEPDDARYVAELKAKPFNPTRRSLNDETWQQLAHPDEDRLLSALFATVTPMIAAAQAQPHKNANLVRKEALESGPAYKAVKYVASSLGVHPPEVYARGEQKEAAAFVNCIDKQTLVPVFLLGQPLLNDKRPERELVFDLARRLAHLRPERFIRLVLPQPAQLAHLLDAAAALAFESEGLPADEELGKTVAAFKRSLTPVQLEQVAAVGRKLRASGQKGEAAALGWLQATDLTAARASFVLGGDLESCARLIAAEPVSATALPATQRLLDLIWSSVTEEVFAVRKHLGLM